MTCSVSKRCKPYMNFWIDCRRCEAISCVLYIPDVMAGDAPIAGSEHKPPTLPFEPQIPPLPTTNAIETCQKKIDP